MLQLVVELVPERWDDEKEEFLEAITTTLQLEHSLISLSKWESKWCKPFYSKTAKTYEETIDYIKCMTLTKNVDPTVYDKLSKDNVDAINKYIEAPMTATYVSEKNGGKSSGEQITSELIYYWMIALNIPFECQKWHINRLLMLIKVCNVKNQPPKKMSKKQLMSRNASLNAARKKRLNTKG